MSEYDENKIQELVRDYLFTNLQITVEEDKFSPRYFTVNVKLADKVVTSDSFFVKDSNSTDWKTW